MTSHTLQLGQSDLTVGPIAYGCWRFAGTSIQDADAKIRTALDNGMTLIDTADIYGFGEPSGFGGAEALLGEVLHGNPQLREQMVLATKGGIIPPRPYDSRPDYLQKALDASLTRLKTESVDLYQIHRPDLTTPFADVAGALNAMVSAGKARYIGVSNFTTAQTRALQAHLDHPLITVQPEFSVLEQSPITDGTLDLCSETGMTALAWSPLAGGRLATGDSWEGDDPVILPRVIEVVDKLAKKHSTTRSNIALAFTRAHQASVIPIIGTQRLDRIRESAQVTQIELSARDFYDLVEARRGVSMP